MGGRPAFFSPGPGWFARLCLPLVRALVARAGGGLGVRAGRATAATHVLLRHDYIPLCYLPFLCLPAAWPKQNTYTCS